MSEYTDSVEKNLSGLEAVSTGPCPGCQECADSHGYEDTDKFNTDLENGSVCAEAHFSWTSCGICGSQLGGDREAWHGIDSDGNLMHFDDACTDCVVYLANGEEPNARQST
jgi:hypothetical protein